MRHTSLLALFGSCVVVAGTTLALPRTALDGSAGAAAPLQIVDDRSGRRQLCEAAKLAASDALEALDFEAYRGWQGRVRASCLAAAAP